MCRGIYGQMKEFLESNGEDAFCINTIPMSIDFWYKENKKLLEVLNCSGKANFSIGNKENSFNFRKELIDSISEEILKNLKKRQ